MKLKNKNLLITGANGGIGTSLIEELLKTDIKTIYAGCRDTKKLTIKDKRVIPIELDVLDYEDIKKAKDKIKDLDILINNAGINLNSSTLEKESFNNVVKEMNINFFSTYKMCLEFKDILIKKEKSTIVNIISLLAYISLPINSTYAASKAALHSITQALRSEFKKYNLNVIGVYPGPVDTAMTKHLENEKANPNLVAKEIINAIIKEKTKLFPEPHSKAIHKMFIDDYEEVEKLFQE